MSTPFTHPGLPNLRHVADPDVPLVLRASDHQPAPLMWLWPGRIPLGSITLLAGDPGSGKSLFALDLASRITAGLPWPDETRAEGGGGKVEEAPPNSGPPPSALPLPPSKIPPSSVLILSATDQFHDTILPRLAAAGADQDRVYVLDNLTNLRTEMEKLRDTIDGIPDLKLLVIDPINFYVGPGDAHFQTVVRSVLQPLAALAQKRGFAILAITHFRKNDGAAIHRAAGSMGFVATARTIWTITPDQDDSSRRYLVPLKNNLTATTTTLAFQITNLPLPPGEGRGEGAAAASSACDSPTPDSRLLASHLTWDPTPLSAVPRTPARTLPATLRDEAARFLTQALADGPRRAAELLDEADARGLTRRTVQRAFHDLAGHTKKEGLRAGWWWSLGEYPIADIPELPCDNPLLEPTYAADVADQISFTRNRAQIEQQLATAALAAALHKTPPHKTSPQKTVSPSHGVSPSPKPRQKSTNPTTAPLSPSQHPSPSPNPNLPPSALPLPPSTKPGPLHAIMRHVLRPHPEPQRPCTEPKHHEPPHP